MNRSRSTRLVAGAVLASLLATSPAAADAGRTCLGDRCLTPDEASLRVSARENGQTLEIIDLSGPVRELSVLSGRFVVVTTTSAYLIGARVDLLERLDLDFTPSAIDRLPDRLLLHHPSGLLRSLAVDVDRNAFLYSRLDTPILGDPLFVAGTADAGEVYLYPKRLVEHGRRPRPVLALGASADTGYYLAEGQIWALDRQGHAAPTDHFPLPAVHDPAALREQVRGLPWPRRLAVTAALDLPALRQLPLADMVTDSAVDAAAAADVAAVLGLAGKGADAAVVRSLDTAFDLWSPGTRRKALSAAGTPALRETALRAFVSRHLPAVTAPEQQKQDAALFLRVLEGGSDVDPAPLAAVVEQVAERLQDAAVLTLAGDDAPLAVMAAAMPEAARRLVRMAAEADADPARLLPMVDAFLARLEHLSPTASRAARAPLVDGIGRLHPLVRGRLLSTAPIDADLADTVWIAVDPGRPGHEEIARSICQGVGKPGKAESRSCFVDAYAGSHFSADERGERGLTAAVVAARPGGDDDWRALSGYPTAGAQLVIGAEAPDTVIEDLLRAAFEGAGLASSREAKAAGSMGAPLHPLAASYFKRQGLRNLDAEAFTASFDLTVESFAQSPQRRIEGRGLAQSSAGACRDMTWTLRIDPRGQVERTSRHLTIVYTLKREYAPHPINTAGDPISMTRTYELQATQDAIIEPISFHCVLTSGRFHSAVLSLLGRFVHADPRDSGLATTLTGYSLEAYVERFE